MYTERSCLKVREEKSEYCAAGQENLERIGKIRQCQ